MTIGTSLFLIAVGAILKFATHFHVVGIDLQTVSVILMLVEMYRRAGVQPAAPPRNVDDRADERRPVVIGS